MDFSAAADLVRGRVAELVGRGECTVRGLAVGAGLSQGFVALWVGGRRRASARTLDRIMRAAGIDLVGLVGDARSRWIEGCKSNLGPRRCARPKSSGGCAGSIGR